MDFSAAKYFDEEERLNEISAEAQETKHDEKEAWIKRVRYLVFG